MPISPSVTSWLVLDGSDVSKSDFRTWAQAVEAVFSQVDFSATLTPAQITADQNNYSPTGLAAANVLRLSSDASRTVTGLATGASGRVVMIANVGAQPIVFADESASSTAANRFALTSALTLGPDQIVLFLYDATSSRWRMIGGSSISIGTAIGDLVQLQNVGGIAGLPAVDGSLLTGIAAGPAPAKQIFTSSGTWNRPTGHRFAKATVVGGGAGGAGCPASSSGQNSAGTGGGAGAVAIVWLDVTAIPTVTVTIGAQGNGGAAGLNNGGGGGTTSFGSHASAGGGTGGTSVASGTAVQQDNGGIGGAATAGDIQIAGQAGGPYVRLSGTSAIGLAYGAGGPFGVGGAWPGFGVAGNNGSGYGSGGSGCASTNGGAARAGGNGTGGICVVESW